jgi:NAD(P)-dependent dehydrogenase (short-subunit alcohol dehydrogenase family)
MAASEEESVNMKYAFVTGANRGLGLGFCHQLVDKGYTVFAATRRVGEFPYTHAHVIPVELHVDDDDSIRRAYKEINERNVQIDLLINNAGVSKRSASVGSAEQVCELEHVNRQALLHMFEVNAVSPLMVVHYFLPLLSSNSFVVNITSGRSSFANEGTNANYGYRASKMALNMFTKALVYDLPKYVQTFAVHPGIVATDMKPDGEVLPDEAARQVLSILDNWDTSKNGAFLNTDGSLFPL